MTIMAPWDLALEHADSDGIGQGDAGRMHAVDEKTMTMVRAVLEYAQQRMSYDSPPLDHPMRPSDLQRLAPNTITGHGMGGIRALHLFEDVIAPACLSSDHPMYLSFIPSAPTEASKAFDLVVSASALYGGSWLEGSGAVHLENQVLAFLAHEFGLPQQAGGVFVQGGTIGNLSALVAARETARRQRRDSGQAMPERWSIVCGEESHSSIRSAARVMDADVIVVPSDDSGRLQGERVRQTLAELSPEKRDGIAAIVACAGTTNFGLIDDLEGCAQVAHEEGVWFHVDGAYGLAGCLVPELRSHYKGVESADSVIVDPHKWLFAPYDACALIYRDPEQGRLAHQQHASYLETLDTDQAWNPSDYAINLTRRPRGLPLWFSLAAYGADEYRHAIATAVRLAQRISEEIRLRPQLELLRKPELSVVVFRHEGWKIKDYELWSQSLLDRQIAFVQPSFFQGEPVVRFAIINPRTTFDQLVMVLDTMDKGFDGAGSAS